MNPRDTKRQPAKSGVVIPHKAVWHQRLVAALIYFLLRLASSTIRYEWRDESGLLDRNAEKPTVFCIWHNRLALSLEFSHTYLKPRGRKQPLAAMVSASKDGGLLTRVLELYDVQPVRGSTSRRGRQALLELTKWAERGYDLAITPDGPRGPCYVVQDGAMALAQVTGLGIVPASYHLSWKIQVKSWDRFQIPIPFTKCVMHLGSPIHVPREATEAEREVLREQLQQRLIAMSRD